MYKIVYRVTHMGIEPIFFHPNRSLYESFTTSSQPKAYSIKGIPTTPHEIYFSLSRTKGICPMYAPPKSTPTVPMIVPDKSFVFGFPRIYSL